MTRRKFEEWFAMFTLLVRNCFFTRCRITKRKLDDQGVAGYSQMNKTQQTSVTDFCTSLLLKSLIILTSSLFFAAKGSEELEKFVVNMQEELYQTKVR